MAKKKPTSEEVDLLRAEKRRLVHATNFQTRDKTLTKEQIGALYNELIRVELELIEAITYAGNVRVRKVIYD